MQCALSVTKPIATFACLVISGGAVEATIRHVADSVGHDTAISADAGATRGTLIYSSEAGGYIGLGWRDPVEPGVRRVVSTRGAAI
jgi:hypothetical protein